MRAGSPGPRQPRYGDDGRWLGVSLDPADIAGLLMEMIVPKLSDGGAVFVLERGHGRNSGQIVTRRLASRFVQRDGHPAETVLPAGEVFAFPVDSPYGVCLSSGTPQVFGGPDAVTMKRIRPAGRELLSHHSAFLAVPLTAGGDVTGVLVTSRGGARGPYSDADVAVIADLAGRAGTGIAHAAEFARHRRDSRALQEGLVPAPPPVPDLVEVAWRSTPAPGEVVGGDWWEHRHAARDADRARGRRRDGTRARRRDAPGAAARRRAHAGRSRPGPGGDDAAAGPQRRRR